MKHLTKSEERNARSKRNVAREIEYFNMQKCGPGEGAKAYFERYIRPHEKKTPAKKERWLKQPLRAPERTLMTPPPHLLDWSKHNLHCSTI